MKSFLVDEDLPRSLARALSIAGMEAVHVIDAGMRGRPDADVLAGASRSGRALVTADLDFSNLLEYPLGSHAGIVVVRFPNEAPVGTVNAAVVDALRTVADEELPGSLVIVEPGRVRLRR